MFCTVITQSRAVGIGDGLTYSCDESVRPGDLVRVPLRSKQTLGLVIDVLESKPEGSGDLKVVTERVMPGVLPEEYLKSIRWMAEETFTSIRYVLGLWLPTTEWDKLLPTEVTGYSVSHSPAPVRGAKREEVCEYLRTREWASEHEILDHTSASPAVLKAMAAAKILTRSKRRAEFPGPLPEPPVSIPPVLTREQQLACEAILESTKPSLLFGVTGSGKTEVYACLIDSALKTGGQAIVLVPEILLSETIIDRFAKILPRERISLVHSKLTPAQRRKEWLKARTGEAALILGSRSALFAPCRDLRLIVIDEEQEWTYKNERMPRYHARTAAERIAKDAGAKLVLGSATPSIESWMRARKNEFTLIRLPNRYGKAPLPKVTVVDLAEVKFGENYPFSPPLIEGIRQRLAAKEQSVLFLNRRGTASALLCLECRRRIVSPESQLPFTVHMGPGHRPFLLDHASGLRAPAPDACPHCGSTRLHAVGAGTQRLETLLKKLFPTARVLRADSDTLESPQQMRELLSTMEKGKADILVGTQTVALGLDLPQVTLAGVLVADVGLSLPHFRASERVFQLLTQLSGRSGRRVPGEVIIQTFRPEAPEVIAAATHDAENFLEQELKMRMATKYPPFTRMVRLLVRGTSSQFRARQLHAQLSGKAMKLGVQYKIAAAPTFAGGGKEWHVLIRGEDPVLLLKDMSLADVAVDVDPTETL